MFSFPKNVLKLINALNAKGFEAYAVGGCVRDSLLSKTPNDWDLTTNALPEQIKDCFSGYKVIDTGIRHGTVTVLAGGEPYEITTYRRDGEYSDHRRPDNVEFVSDLREDLERRDFTVNAMACHPDEGLIDLFEGQEDLQKGVIRCVGDPEKRFTEDALRILRAARFASTYDFSIESKTAEAALKLLPTLDSVSPERIFVELKKLLCGKGAERILLEYPEIVFRIFPELAPMRGFRQNNPHHAYDVWTHTVKSIANAPVDAAYRLAMLFHDSGKPQAHTVGEDGFDHFKGHPLISKDITAKALERMKPDRATYNKVLLYVAEHDLRIPTMPKNVRRQMARLGADAFGELLPIMRADLRAQNPELRAEKEAYVDAIEREYQRALAENACVKVADLQINGNDLKRMGLQGVEIGKTLGKLLDAVVCGSVENEREALLQEAERLVGKG